MDAIEETLRRCEPDQPPATRGRARTVSRRLAKDHPMSLGIDVVSNIEFNEADYVPISQLTPPTGKHHQQLV